MIGLPPPGQTQALPTDPSQMYFQTRGKQGLSPGQTAQAGALGASAGVDKISGSTLSADMIVGEMLLLQNTGGKGGQAGPLPPPKPSTPNTSLFGGNTYVDVLGSPGATTSNAAVARMSTRSPMAATMNDRVTPSGLPQGGKGTPTSIPTAPGKSTPTGTVNIDGSVTTSAGPTAVTTSATGFAQATPGGRGNPWFAPNPMVAYQVNLMSMARTEMRTQALEIKVAITAMKLNIDLAQNMAATDLALGKANAQQQIYQAISSIIQAASSVAKRSTM